MSLDEQARVESYKLADLPHRHAYVLTRHNGCVNKIITHNIPWNFDTRMNGVDYKKKFLETVRPLPPRIPEKNIFERVTEENNRQQLRVKNIPEGL